MFINLTLEADEGAAIGLVQTKLTNYGVSLRDGELRVRAPGLSETFVTLPEGGPYAQIAWAIALLEEDYYL